MTNASTDGPSSVSASRIVTSLFDPHDREKSSWIVPGDAAPEKALDIEGSAAEKDGMRRGRRRRSSELESNVPAGSKNECVDTVNITTVRAVEGEDVPIDGSSKAETASSSTSRPSARLWWQRSEDGEEPAEPVAIKTALNIDRSKPRLDTWRLPSSARARKMSQDTAESSQSPTVRSPAAAFLSSMNETLASPVSTTLMGSNDGGATLGLRGYSLSPVRSTVAQLRTNTLPDVQVLSRADDSAEADSPIGTAGHFGLAGAAANLYNSVQSSPSLRSMASYSAHSDRAIRPDDEGARIGPGGRYLLGKTIGFGGFSTVREAWDVGESMTDASVNVEDVKAWHRVAVKIVYSNDAAEADRVEKSNGAQSGRGAFIDKTEESAELELWKSIPSHPNLLPLLHHTRIHRDGDVSHAGAPSTIDFLVMPYCDGNLLAHVRMMGAPRGERTGESSRSGSVSGLPLERSPSTSGQHSVIVVKPGPGDSSSSILPHSRSQRTGSGFIPQAHRSTASSDRVPSTPLLSLINRSSSVAMPLSASVNSSPSSAAPSSLLRRGSLRMRAAQAQAQASRGLPMMMARDVVRQITEAMLCLHHIAGIMHGDLKLENVLGQPAQRRRQATPLRGVSDPGPGPGPESEASAPICWRVADFGLSRRVVSKADTGCVSVHGMWNAPPVASYRNKGTASPLAGGGLRRHSSSGGSSLLTARSQGGSLAYTAPEAFLVTDAVDDDEGASPFAADMWAMGCIVYALFAGRLPFNDAFEPRLQNKIAQGRWEMPDRLKRRGRAAMAPPDEVQRDDSLSSKGRTNSFGALAQARRQAFQLTPVADTADGSAPADSEALDMSASMPSLSRRHDFAAAATSMSRSNSTQSVRMNNNHNHDNDTSTLDGSFTAATWEEEEDPTSDADETVDIEMDGTSRDRTAVRKILRGLLESDRRRRWTIGQLAALDWLRQPSAKVLCSAQCSETATPNAAEDLPSSLRDEIMPRPGLGTGNLTQSNILEDRAAAGEAEGELKDGGDVRGRAARRDDRMPRAKPIDIDRSKSRSRSRARGERLGWDMDVPMDGGGFHRRQQQVQDQNSSPTHEYHPNTKPYTHRHALPDFALLTDDRSRSREWPSTSSSSTRSASSDAYGRRGRTMYGPAKGEGGRTNSSTSSGRGGSRSTSRSRRADLDLIMPQLSLQHRTSRAGLLQSRISLACVGDEGQELEREAASRDGSPAPAALQYDDHNAARTSIWKSSMRARDRLTSLMNSSGAEAQRRSTHDTVASGEGEGPSEDRPW